MAGLPSLQHLEDSGASAFLPSGLATSGCEDFWISKMPGQLQSTFPKVGWSQGQKAGVVIDQATPPLLITFAISRWSLRVHSSLESYAKWPVSWELITANSKCGIFERGSKRTAFSQGNRRKVQEVWMLSPFLCDLYSSPSWAKYVYVYVCVHINTHMLMNIWWARWLSRTGNCEDSMKKWT